jgi:hypothetical protein
MKILDHSDYHLAKTPKVTLRECASIVVMQIKNSVEIVKSSRIRSFSWFDMMTHELLSETVFLLIWDYKFLLEMVFPVDKIRELIPKFLNLISPCLALKSELLREFNLPLSSVNCLRWGSEVTNTHKHGIQIRGFSGPFAKSRLSSSRFAWSRSGSEHWIVFFGVA